MSTNRFAYEEAKSILDEYVKNHESARFRRAYQRLQFLVHCVACCDFSAGKVPGEEAMAHAWEDVQAAFLGCGEHFLTGAVVGTWIASGNKKQRAKWKSVLAEAFRKAEAATHESVPRRYLEAVRRGPIRDPSDGHAYPTPLVPLWGPTMDDYMFDTQSVKELVQHWSEMADKAPPPEEPVRKSKSDGKPKLKLVVNNT